jgi:hypothetical protein
MMAFVDRGASWKRTARSRKQRAEKPPALGGLHFPSTEVFAQIL